MDYEQFFGLKDTPFRLNPDPGYFFPSVAHQAALQTMIDGAHARVGIMVVTGGQGTGKTLTLRTLLKHLGDSIIPVLVLNPRLSPDELLKVLVEKLAAAVDRPDEVLPEDPREAVRELLRHMSVQDRNGLVVVDEAQNLPNETLRELGQLSELAAETGKPLQVVLAGQPELEDRLRSLEFADLEHRVAARHRLEPLSRTDTFAYVNHRLQVAGGDGPSFFPTRVLADVHQVSGGIPRLINILCERALMAAFVDGKNAVDRQHIKRARESIVGEKLPRHLSRSEGIFKERLVRGLIVGFLIVAILAVAYQFILKDILRGPTAVPSPTVIQPAPIRPPDSTASRPITPPEKKEPPVALIPPPASPSPVPVQPASGEPTMPAPPAYIVGLPAGGHVLSVDRDKGTAYLWENQSGAVRLRAEFKWPKPPQKGLYLVGESLNRKRFAFYYPDQSYSGALPPAEMWQEIKKIIDPDMIPMISHGVSDTPESSAIQTGQTISELLSKWAAAWEKKDAKQVNQYYGDPFASFTDTDEKPVVSNLARLQDVRTDLFKRSGAIKLTLSESSVLLDPESPTRAVAVFSQKYSSAIYSDEGIKALYFNLTDAGSGKPEWKIIAQVFSPTAGPRRTPTEAKPDAKPEPKPEPAAKAEPEARPKPPESRSAQPAPKKETKPADKDAVKPVKTVTSQDPSSGVAPVAPSQGSSDTVRPARVPENLR